MLRNFKASLLIAPILLLGAGCVPSTQQNQSTGSPEGRMVSNNLDLSSRGLKKVPEYVFNLTDLEALDLSANELTDALPAEIRNLQNLKMLSISGNQMTGVPAEIGQLQNLEVLNLSNNKLTGLPYELGNLKNLKKIDVSGNNYSQLDLDIIIKKLPAGVMVIK